MQNQSTPKDAHNKAPRRVHKTQHSKSHLEGCPHKGISKDAHKEGARRIHNKKPRERNPESTYTSRSNVKLTFERKKKDYNESRPEQNKYSANAASGTSKAESLPAHRYLSIVRVLQHGNIYKQIIKPLKQIPTSQSLHLSPRRSVRVASRRRPTGLGHTTDPRRLIRT